MNLNVTGVGAQTAEAPRPPKKTWWPFGANGAARNGSSNTLGDRVFKGTTMIFASAIALLAILILANMALNAKLPWAKFGASFLWRTVWDPVAEEFGALPFIYGTAVTSLLALLLAVPVSVGVAIFLVETAPRSL